MSLAREHHQLTRPAQRLVALFAALGLVFEVQGIVEKQFLEFPRSDLVPSEVADVAFIPIELDVTRHCPDSIAAVYTMSI